MIEGDNFYEKIEIIKSMSKMFYTLKEQLCELYVLIYFPLSAKGCSERESRTSKAQLIWLNCTKLLGEKFSDKNKILKSHNI